MRIAEILAPLAEASQAPLCRPRLLDIQLELRAALNTTEVAAWHQSLKRLVERLDLVVAASPTRLLIQAQGRAMSPAERGEVMGWLAAQPGVAKAHIASDPCMPAPPIHALPGPAAWVRRAPKGTELLNRSAKAH